MNSEWESKWRRFFLLQGKVIINVSVQKLSGILCSWHCRVWNKSKKTDCIFKVRNQTFPCWSAHFLVTGWALTPAAMQTGALPLPSVLLSVFPMASSSIHSTPKPSLNGHYKVIFCSFLLWVLNIFFPLIPIQKCARHFFLNLFNLHSPIDLQTALMTLSISKSSSFSLQVQIPQAAQHQLQ